MLIKHAVGALSVTNFERKKEWWPSRRTPGHQTRNIGRYIS